MTDAENDAIGAQIEMQCARYPDRSEAAWEAFDNLPNEWPTDREAQFDVFRYINDELGPESIQWEATRAVH